MTQDYLRAAHRTGRLIEITFDTPRDEPPVLESGVPRKRAPRVPGGRSAKERKRMQRQRDGWRPELFELTGDQEPGQLVDSQKRIARPWSLPKFSEYSMATKLRML